MRIYKKGGANKTMAKKVTAFLMATLLIFTLVACGNTGKITEKIRCLKFKKQVLLIQRRKKQ